MVKTNAMRILDSAGINYRIYEYEVDEDDLSGESTAKKLGLPPEQLFKTLVLKGERIGYFVCCIPCDSELDLKKAAREISDKKVEMLHVKDILGVTGYIRGGCSPVGMKKDFPTMIDETSVLFDEILISAGVRGMMLAVDPEKLIEFKKAKTPDLVMA